MFTDQSFEPTGFTSQISTEKSQTTSNVQTETVIYESKEAQKIELRTAGTQTLEPAKPKVDFDYEKLAIFLKRVTPGVIEVLDEVYGSNAFEGYDLGTSGEPVGHVQLLSSIRILSYDKTDTKISDVTWSAAGGLLAVSHSATHHTTWCNHLSEIKFYKISREDKIEETPEKTLEVQSCVTSISYHPTEPSILAAGLLNGDVFLWNLRDDDSVTPLQVCVHGDCVTSLMWRPRTITDPTNIVTTSADGYIYINQLTANFTNVQLHKKFKIAKEHNPSENLRPRSAGGKRERAIEAGLSIACLDFSSKDPTIFLVGTQCGGIYKCSTERGMLIDSGEGDDEIKLEDPVIDEYERHEGSVTCVKCSPTRNIFLTCGTNREIRIYDFAQASSLQTISVENTVVKLSWYLGGNRDIIAAFGVSSNVNFYDATNGKLMVNMQLESAREDTSCLAFNLRRDVAAVGDTVGRLEIWKIPRQTISS